MKRRLLAALGIMMSIIPSALLSQNLPPIAIDDTVHMCGNTVTIYVQNNDTNPDGDSLVLSIYAGSVNGSFSVNGNAIDYTPNVGYTGTDTLIYSLCDDGVPPLCDTAVVIIHVGADYLMNESASICRGDSIFLEGAWRNDDGVFTDWYTTGFGCDSIVVTVLTVNDNPSASITASGSLNFCPGDSVTLTANGGTSFNWSTGDSSQSITVYTAGTYSVIVSDTNGCSGNASANVNVAPAPTATISPSGPITICTGNSATLTASAGASWQWSNGATSQSITVNSAGTYSVVVTDTNGCSASASVNVNLAPTPNATISPSAPVSFCTGDSATLIASAGTSWQWSNGATTQSIIVSNSGTYWVIVNNNSCSDTSMSINVTVNPLPNATISANGPISFCTGDSVTLTANGGLNFIWSTGNTSQSITVYTAGTYSVVVSDANGCSGSASANVNVAPSPNAVISPPGPITLCSGDTVTLSVNTGTSWQWSNGGTFQSITVNNSGVYWVIASNTSCSDTSAPVTVTFNAQPVVTITPSGSLSFCAGDSVILTANGGSSFNWSTGATSQSIIASSTGTYSVAVTNANGCSGNASVNVNVSPAPNAVISPSGPITICSGDATSLTASAGVAWQWSNGATTQTIVVTNPGNYWVIVSNGSCTDTSSAVVVNVNTIPVATITANGPTTFCQGGTVTLTASNGNSWLWSTGVTTQSINVVSSGNYWVIVSNGNGCTDTSSSTLVMVNPLPVAYITASGPLSYCEGGSVTLTASNGSSWLWSNGVVAQTLVVTGEGTFYVTVSDANGCSATSASTIVNEIPLLTAGISANGPLDLCQGETVTLAASGGTSWIWSTGATSQSITVSNAGSYYVVASDQCGSDTTTTVTVSVTNGLPSAGIAAAQYGYTYTFTDNSTGATSWSWNFGDNATSSEQNPIHEYSTSGVYMVTLIVSNSCGSDTTSMLLELGDGTDQLGLFNAFSPNGDGFNDTWTIPLAELYSNNTVTIVNRWGSEVWKATAYDNNNVVWNGQNLNGDNLPDGSYFYIITYNGKDSRGWVFIKR